MEADRQMSTQTKRNKQKTKRKTHAQTDTNTDKQGGNKTQKNTNRIQRGRGTG